MRRMGCCVTYEELLDSIEIAYHSQHMYLASEICVWIWLLLWFFAEIWWIFRENQTYKFESLCFRFTLLWLAKRILLSPVNSILVHAAGRLFSNICQIAINVNIYWYALVCIRVWGNVNDMGATWKFQNIQMCASCVVWCDAFCGNVARLRIHSSSHCVRSIVGLCDVQDKIR